MTKEQRRGYLIEIESSTSAPGEANEAVVAAAAVSYAAEAAGDDVLRIDGDVVPFARTSEGIRIFYQPPAADLLAAARSYVDTQREKSE